MALLTLPLGFSCGGSGPLGANSANPRYFADVFGGTVYLAGSHTWSSFQDSGVNESDMFDFEEYLDFIGKYYHNFIRLWIWEQAAWVPWSSEEVHFTPLPYQRTGPGKAVDGKPKFDLSLFNPAFFERLRSRVQSAGRRGIFVSIMLFQGFSIETKGLRKGNPWKGHPFNKQNNINEVGGDLDCDGEGTELHTLASLEILELQERFVRQVIDTVSDLDNVLYEISNESHADSTEWQYHMIEYIREYEKNKARQHPVIMSVQYPDGKNSSLFQSPADAISPNAAGGFRDDPPPAEGNKVILLDTDHLWGVGGDYRWVWKSFLMGHNPIFMDPVYDSKWELARRAMGDTRRFAERIDLQNMIPHPELASSGYCLANPGKEYLIYLPDSVSVNVDLSGSPERVTLEWFDPVSGEYVHREIQPAAGRQTFESPFKGAVLYIRAL